LGHHVRVVHNALAALEAARANVPEVMLIDIGLPGMNGYDLATAIRADASLQRVVLVALTGDGGAEDKARAMAAGFDYHLVKPVDIDALGSLVLRVADAQPSAGERGAEAVH
jgi:CheY-like chemotaxis protein